HRPESLSPHSQARLGFCQGLVGAGAKPLESVRLSMTPEHFRQIEELYHTAREATPEERAALLAQADPKLRGKLEALLSQPKGVEFLERPAVQNATDLLEDSTGASLDAGARLGPYQVESKLGEGG